MSNEIVEAGRVPSCFSMPEHELLTVLENSVYPGAKPVSISLALHYCRAAVLDPLQKPVHIVPMWDKTTGSMRDVILPGIGLYRTQAARTGRYAGMTEPEFGPDESRQIGGVEITFPAWCKVTVFRQLDNGHLAGFPAVERWIENYAKKGGKEKSVAPNEMWAKRPYAQLAKCTEAQALRKAFPEIGAQPTAEEMEGRTYDAYGEAPDVPPPAEPQSKSARTADTTGSTIEGEAQRVDAGKNRGTPPPQQKDTPPPQEKDATQAGGGERVTAGELAYIRRKAKDAGISEPDLCAQYGITGGIEAMTKAQFAQAKTDLLNAR